MSSFPTSTGHPPLKQRLGWPLLRALQRAGLLVSREDVTWCYRHLLGREPESEAALMANCRHLSFRALVRAITESPEYRGRSAGPGHETGAEIAQTVDAAAFRRQIDDWHHHHPQQLDAGYVQMHFQRLLDTLNLMAPLLPAGGSVVDYSARGYFTQAVQRLLHAGRQVDVKGVNFELDAHAERFGLACHDLCVNTEVIEHLIFDPARMVHEINRMLRPGGHLVLSTPNALAVANALRLMTGHPPTVWNQLSGPGSQYYDRHNRDWTPFEVTRLLEAHGFEVLRAFTRDYYDDTLGILKRHADLARMVKQHSTHSHFGDTQFVVARKRDESAGPVRGAWLYVRHNEARDRAPQVTP